MKRGRPLKPVGGMGARLRMVRERLGLSQGAMAEDLRVTRSAISAWEGGLRQLEGPALVAIEALYGVDHRWLLSGEGSLLCKHSLNITPGVHLVPVVDSVMAWDTSGQLSPSARVPTRPLPEGEVQRLLERSGGGTPWELVFLEAFSGFPPSIPPEALVLLNVSQKVRQTGGSLGTFLVRRGPEDPGVRLGTLERSTDGWVLGAPPGAPWPPQILHAEEGNLLPLVLGRVVGIWSRW